MHRVIRSKASLAGMSLLLSGCSLLFPGMEPFPDPGLFPEPTTLAAFGRGSATIEMTSGGETQTITLDQVDAASSLDSIMGAMVTWRNDEGWSMQVSAYNPSAMGMGSGPVIGDITLQRIDGHAYWTAGSYVELTNRCIVDISELSADNLSGQATCHTLRWVDGTAPWGTDGPAYVAGEEPFNLEVTFEAQPVADVTPA